MNDPKPERDDHLSQMETHWTVVYRAKGGPGSAEADAQAKILELYHVPASRYLFASLRDQAEAENLWQELSLRFLRGDFRNADREKGRFRDFLKTALAHLIIDYHKRKQKAPRQLADNAPEPNAPEDSTVESDRQFFGVVQNG